METGRRSRHGRITAAAAVLAALLAGQAVGVRGLWLGVSAVAAAPALRVPPDEPRATPAPAPAPAATHAPPTAAAAPPRQGAPPVQAAPQAVAPAAVAVPPPPPPPAPATAGQAPLSAADMVPPLPPRTGPGPAPTPGHARGHHAPTPPATASDVPPVLPWAVVPGIAVALALLLVATVWLVRWPWRLLSTARLAMLTPVTPAVPAPVPGPAIALGAAAQRLPSHVQRDLVELAALLDEEDLGGP